MWDAGDLQLIMDRFVCTIWDFLKYPIMQTLVGIFVGGLITWIVSKHYYSKAGEDLKEEAIRLHFHNKLMLVMLEDQGSVKLRRDDDGDIVGISYSLKAKLPKHQLISDSKFHFTPPNERS